MQEVPKRTPWCWDADLRGGLLGQSHPNENKGDLTLKVGTLAVPVSWSTGRQPGVSETVSGMVGLARAHPSAFMTLVRSSLLNLVGYIHA